MSEVPYLRGLPGIPNDGRAEPQNQKRKPTTPVLYEVPNFQWLKDDLTEEEAFQLARMFHRLRAEIRQGIVNNTSPIAGGERVAQTLDKEPDKEKSKLRPDGTLEVHYWFTVDGERRRLWMAVDANHVIKTPTRGASSYLKSLD